MICYVAHAFGGDIKNLEKARKITHDLQIADKENTYICPLIAFSHLQYGEFEYEQEMAMCFDLLQMCDKLIVAGDISEGVDMEISLAEKLINADGKPMEIEYFENNE